MVDMFMLLLLLRRHNPLASSISANKFESVDCFVFYILVSKKYSNPARDSNVKQFACELGCYHLRLDSSMIHDAECNEGCHWQIATNQYIWPYCGGCFYSRCTVPHVINYTDALSYRDGKYSSLLDNNINFIYEDISCRT